MIPAVVGGDQPRGSATAASAPGIGPVGKTLRLAVLSAMLAGGCATSSPSPQPAASGPGNEPRQDARLTRCSSDDPDRHAWFCVVGQILYSALSMLQQDISARLR